MLASVRHCSVTDSFRLQARRFITFIDACYESKTRLFVSSEVPIFQIFSDDTSQTPDAPVSDHMRTIMDDLVIYLFRLGQNRFSLF